MEINAKRTAGCCEEKTRLMSRMQKWPGSGLPRARDDFSRSAKLHGLWIWILSIFLLVCPFCGNYFEPQLPLQLNILLLGGVKRMQITEQLVVNILSPFSSLFLCLVFCLVVFFCKKQYYTAIEIGVWNCHRSGQSTCNFKVIFWIQL
jgi:hypothetical protein